MDTMSQDVHRLHKFSNSSSAESLRFQELEVLQISRTVSLEDTIDLSIARGCNAGATSFELDAHSSACTPWRTWEEGEGRREKERERKRDGREALSHESSFSSISMRRWTGEDVNLAGGKLMRTLSHESRLNQRKKTEAGRKAFELVAWLLVGLTVLVSLLFTLICSLELSDVLHGIPCVANRTLAVVQVQESTPDGKLVRRSESYRRQISAVVQLEETKQFSGPTNDHP